MPPDEFTTLTEVSALSPLTVQVDFIELLRHCDGDRKVAYAIITELKDLLR